VRHGSGAALYRKQKQVFSKGVAMMGTVGESFHNRSMQLPDELLQGAIDLHVHAGPHLKSSPRRVDPFQAAEEARDAGMRAIVYMDVFQDSSGTAWMVSRMVPGIDVFGGIILNTGHGGLNPRAVKTAMHYGGGAKFVSFGAHSTHFRASIEARLVDGKAVPLKDLFPKFAEQELSRAIRIPLEGPVPAELAETLELIASNQHVFLNTGHVSGLEALRLIDLANQYGIDRVLVASLAVDELTNDQQREAVRGGALLERSFAHFVGTGSVPKTHYYVEREYMYDTLASPPKNRPSLRGVGDQIRAIGPEHFVLDSDYGVRSCATPVEGMRQFIACLLDMDFETDEIRMMTSSNPARLLGLE
jgi:hypothetical protein